MSIWKYVFDNDIFQRWDLERLKRHSEVIADQNRVQNRGTQVRLIELEEDVAHLTLLCRALMTALMENQTLKAETFQETMHKIDLEDGVADGKASKKKKKTQKPPVPPKLSRRREL